MAVEQWKGTELRHRSSPLGWHPAEVKAAVQMRGETLSGLARRHGLCESYLRVTLLRPSHRGEQIIAAFLRTTPQAIWPERYDAKGKPAYRVKTALRRAA